MVYGEFIAGTQQTKDDIGSEAAVQQIPDFNQEAVILYEGPTQVNSRPLGHVWIVGSSTNAIVGTWTGTQDGQQLVVGSGNDATDGRTPIVQVVVNPNNTFTENFKFNTYLDTTNTTALINLTSGIVAFFSGTDVFKSKSIAYQSTNIISQVKLTPTKTGNINYLIGTANDPNVTSNLITWQSINPSTQTILTSPNYALFYKLTTPSIGVVSNIIIEYQ